MQPEQHQYNFIMDSGNNQPSGPAALRDPKKRMMIAVAFVFVVILLVIIVISVILSLGNKDSGGLKDIVAYQTEILRVTELGLKDSKDLSVKARIGTVQSFVTSDLNQTISLIDGKLTEQELAKFQDITTDKALESALSSNSFDSEIIEQINDLFLAYQEELSEVFKSTSDESEKSILNTANKNLVTYAGL